jgi:hypothetical protein
MKISDLVPTMTAPAPGGEPLCRVAALSVACRRLPEAFPWFVEDPASQKVLEVGQREFRPTWVIPIQG